MEKWLKLYATYTFSTSANLCHRTTRLLNTDVPNCYITQEYKVVRWHRLGEMENVYVAYNCSHFAIWWKFDKVLTKTKITLFLRYGVFKLLPLFPRARPTFVCRMFWWSTTSLSWNWVMCDVASTIPKIIWYHWKNSASSWSPPSNTVWNWWRPRDITSTLWDGTSSRRGWDWIWNCRIDWHNSTEFAPGRNNIILL